MTVAGTSSGQRVPAGEEILRVEHLVKRFPIYGGVWRRKIGQIHAVDDVSFALRAGETLGLVGESGCGKSTLGRLVLRLIEADSGSILFKGDDVTRWSGSRLRSLRREIQIVFQNPFASLNPRRTVHDIIAEALKVHREYAGGGGQRIRELLQRVGLDPDAASRYPHEFSGGQQQRIGIARALALRPQVLVLDEPVSALDVSIQAQVLNLLQDLQEELGLAYLFIAHNLSVVRHISDRVAVMYLGKLVETGDSDSIYQRPSHPYTQALLSAVPLPDPRLRGSVERRILEGDVPNPADPPSGCRFRTRCWKAEGVCATEEPELSDRLSLGHPSACHFPEVARAEPGGRSPASGPG